MKKINNYGDKMLEMEVTSNIPGNPFSRYLEERGKKSLALLKQTSLSAGVGPPLKDIPTNDSTIFEVFFSYRGLNGAPIGPT